MFVIQPSAYAKYDSLIPDHVAVKKARNPAGQQVRNCYPLKTKWSRKNIPTVVPFFRFIERLQCPVENEHIQKKSPRRFFIVEIVRKK